jgi:hypothetical protein
MTSWRAQQVKFPGSRPCLSLLPVAKEILDGVRTPLCTIAEYEDILCFGKTQTWE